VYRVAERVRAGACVRYVYYTVCVYLRTALRSALLHRHHTVKQQHHHRCQLSRTDVCVCVSVCACSIISLSRGGQNVTCRARTVMEHDDDDDGDDDARATGRRGSASTAFHSVLWTRVRCPVCARYSALCGCVTPSRRRPPVGAPCRWWLIKVYYNIRYGRAPPAAAS